jgi:hypothetical protein
MSGPTRTRAERMIIYCAGLAEMEKAELDEVLREAGFRECAQGTHHASRRGANAYREDPAFLLRQIRGPKSFTRLHENQTRRRT